MLTKRGSLGLLVLLLASCSTASLPVRQKPAFRSPAWTRVYLAAPVSGCQGKEVAGWNGGYLLADGGSLLGSVASPRVCSSTDGRQWRPVTLPGLTTLTSITGGYTRMIAGYGVAAYAVGWNGRELAVWRTSNGTQWQEIPLDTSGIPYSSTPALDVSIVAGQHGIIVVGSDAFTPPSFTGFYVWRSSNQGTVFDEPVRVPLPEEASLGGIEIDAVEATQDGFLVSGNNGRRAIILASVDGTRWTSISSQAEISSASVVTALSGNSSTVVIFNTWSPKPGQPYAMYSHGHAWQPSVVDPGRLPDAGVVPLSQQRIGAVYNWGTGFIAIGDTTGDATGEGAGIGSVWYSANGAQWTRQPVRGNGFNAASLIDAAVSNGKMLLIGYPIDTDSDLVMWQATMPRLFPRPQQPPGPAPGKPAPGHAPGAPSAMR